MRILLINPAFDYYSKHLLIGEPLSLAYLAAYLIKYGYTVDILDAVAGSVKKQGARWHYGLLDYEITEKIKKFRPDLVGITCSFSLRIDSTLNIAKMIKEIDKNITTVIGGIHPTIFPLETVRHEEVDYVIVGEGEKSFLSLIRHIENGGDFSKLNIDGCAYKNGNGINMISKKEFIEDLDSIPFPARDLLPMEFYIKRQIALYGLGRLRSASIITSRSCPKRCTFCSMFLSHGNKWRSRSAQNIFEELKILVEKFCVEEIFFMDDNLTLDKDRMVQLCEMILQKGLKFRWNTPNGVGAQYLDNNLINLMKRSGCINICIGIESGNNKIRNKILGKGLSEETIYKCLEACKREKLPVVGFFILGVPGDNEEGFRDTVKMVKRLPLSMIATSFYTPFPGTKLYDECVSKGYIDKYYWHDIYKFNTPIVKTPDFDIAKLRKWEKKIYFEFAKSHFGELFFSIITFKNKFIKLPQIRRFFKEKCAG